MGVGFEFGFGMVGGIWTLMFVLIFGMFVVLIVRNLSEWNKNNHSPRLTVPATVVTKRADVHHHLHDGRTHHSTRYFVTFQVESGDRMELSMSGQEYGLLVEGDAGSLTFQGTRFLGFTREY